MKNLFNSKAKIILISGVTFLLILACIIFVLNINTSANDNKANNAYKSVVKLDIHKITSKQKGSFVDIYVPDSLYKDKEISFLQSDFIGNVSENTLTLLPDSKIFYTVNGRAIIFDFVKQTAYKDNSLHDLVTDPLLLDGKIYIFGAEKSEIYDFRLNKFYSIANMPIHKSFSTATLLPDNKILLTGGFDKTGILKQSDAEIYDPRLNNYTFVSNMNVERVGHTATLLKNGKVIIVGGNYKDQPYSELYDYKTGEFSVLENNGKVRFEHTATLLPDGRVLIIGGNNAFMGPEGHVTTQKTYSDVEIFDPETNKFQKFGNLIFPNWRHSSIPLKSNTILIVGGKECNKKESFICDAQIFNLKTNKTSLVPNASIILASAIKLNDGKVLMISNRYLYWENKIRLYIP